MIRSRNRIQRAEYEAQNEMHLATAARVTSELVNVVGAFGAGKKWEPVTPAAYFDAWTGKQPRRKLMTAAEVARIEAEIEARAKAAADRLTEKGVAPAGASEQNRKQTHAQE